MDAAAKHDNIVISMVISTWRTKSEANFYFVFIFLSHFLYSNNTLARSKYHNYANDGRYYAKCNCVYIICFCNKIKSTSAQSHIRRE
jgi:hypothetical protein